MHSPVSPHKSLDTLSIDPGAETELALCDLGFGVFTFFVLTAGAASGGFLCCLLVWILRMEMDQCWE